MTILQNILAAVNWNLRVTENFTSVSPAGLYGINPATNTGLTLGFLGGEFNGVAVANGTVLLTASTTNYVVANRTTGAVTSATNTTNWTNVGAYLKLYQIVTGTSTMTTVTDKRQALGDGSSFLGGALTGALNEAPSVTIASAATVNIGAAASNTISVTGTTTITAFDTVAASAIRRLVFSGVLVLTHNGTSLILPTGANITTAAGDVAEFVSLGAGNWRCINYMRASGNALLGSPFTGGTLTSSLNEAPAVTLASAATVNIGAAAANTISVTGTTTITAFDALAASAVRRVIFGGALTLTHNATSLILPGAANIATAAGDVAEFVSLGSGNWRCVGYMRANGNAVGVADRSAVTALSISSGVVNIDCALGDYFTLALTANVTSITFTNLPGSGKGASLMVRITQDPSSARTVAWPASFRWEGTAPAVSTTLSAVDLLAISTLDNGTKWDGTLSKGRA